MPELSHGTVDAILERPEALRTIAQWYYRDNVPVKKIIEQSARKWKIYLMEMDVLEAMRQVSLEDVAPDPIDELASAKLETRADLIPYVRSLLVSAARANPNGVAVAALARQLGELLPEARDGGGLPQVGLDEVDGLTDAELTRRWTGQ